MKRTARRALADTKLGRLRETLEVVKASVRAKMEHPFHVIKNLFRTEKTAIVGWRKTSHSCSLC